MTFSDDLNRMYADLVATAAVHGAHCAMRSDLPGSMSMTCTCAMPGPLGLLPSGAGDLKRDIAEMNKRFEGHSLVITPADSPPTITVNRATGFLQMSPELALDAGVITEEEARAQGWTPPPPTPWHRRARWRWQEWRERVGRRIGGWIAGVDLTERDDY